LSNPVDDTYDVLKRGLTSAFQILWR